MEITARSPRRFRSSQPCRSKAGTGPERILQPEDYPLVEIVRDDLLSGYWLYLHPTKHGALEPPRFHPEGVPVQHVCSEMLSSYFIRSTPPVTTPPATTAAVYTAADHLER